MERVLGKTVTTNDTAIHSLSPALEVLADFLSSTQVEPQCNTLVFLPSKFTINRALDGSPHNDQPVIIRFLKQLGEFLTAHPYVNIQLLWLPRSIPFVGFRRAKQLILKAIHIAVLNPELEPHTIRDQKRRTKKEAIATWAQCWHKSPHSSLAYKTALMQPPNSKPHPTFLTKPEAAKFSCCTLCTMYQIITGHAFVGSYMQCFHPTHTPEEVACPCGKPLQTVEHMLLVCPLYTATCYKHLTISSHP